MCELFSDSSASDEAALERVPVSTAFGLLLLPTATLSCCTWLCIDNCLLHVLLLLLWRCLPALGALAVAL